jgi:hypothetical protein
MAWKDRAREQWSRRPGIAGIAGIVLIIVAVALVIWTAFFWRF